MVAPRRRQRSLRLLGLVAIAACHGPAETTAPPRAPAPAALSFIEDDYPRALAEARSRSVPLFVDAWAPWCHSCLSMRSYVFTDPSLASLADRYVWLAIDTEKETNAPFVAKFPHEALPTLFVIRPEDERVTFRWAGTMTPAELRTALTATAPNALGTAHARVISASKGDRAACARLAAAEAPAMPRGTPRADVVAVGITCAHDAKLDPETDVLLEIAIRDATDTGSGLLADDRSALFEVIVETKRSRGDDAGARAIAKQWAALLEREAAAAPTSAARAVFDAHRLSAYVALGEPARAVPMLVQSERDLPGDYNPPARLAMAYLEMGRLDEAEAAIGRATKLVYGPRAMRVLATAADISAARGDRAAEKRSLEEALERTKDAALTAGQRRVRDRLAKRLDALGP